MLFGDDHQPQGAIRGFLEIVTVQYSRVRSRLD
jgi:hypothetical protein